MKGLLFALTLFSQAGWALGDWNCGTVHGQNMDIYAGPALAINGVRNELRAYHSDGATTYYVTSDGRYIWGGNSKNTAVYDMSLKWLANCKKASSGKSWWEEIFEDNGYGGDRGDESP